MLTKLKHFFESQFVSESPLSEADSEHALRLAMAALMIEVAESDYDDSAEERDALFNIVKQSFDLEESEVDEILNLARAEHKESTDYFQFTSLINQNYSEARKIELIENLWKVAFADKVLHKYEEHVIRRIADLIYVSHRDFIATKHQAMKSLRED